MYIMSTSTLPEVNNVHAARPRTKSKPFPHYRPIRLADADLENIGKIQRHMLRAQSRPKSGVNFAQAVRAAVEHYAAHLQATKKTKPAAEVFAIG
jgi:hypothetical protein